jgi:tetratricopeptide (TPR) repeat protein
MRQALIFIFIILSQNTSYASRSQDLFGQKLYFLSLHSFFEENYFTTWTDEKKLMLEKILIQTGIEVLEEYSPQLLKKMKSDSVNFILGRVLFEEGKMNESLELMKSISVKHRYFAESLLVMGMIYLKKNLLNESLNFFQLCSEIAQKESIQNQTDKIRKYYLILEGTCIANKARIYLAQKKFEDALDEYNKVDKNSYKWPYILLEKAWAFYGLEQYNRVLGILVTYKSPLLESYFQTEIELLSALAYAKFCFFEESNIIIDHFFAQHRQDFIKLKKDFENVQDSKYFYNIFFSPNHPIFLRSPLLKKIMVRIKKQLKTSFYLNSIFKIESEISDIKRRKLNNPAQIFDLKHLNLVKKNFEEKFNFYLKKETFKVLNELPQISSELFKIKVDNLSHLRDFIYTKNLKKTGRNLGSEDSRDVSYKEHFWTFNGSFWADELGDYSFGLSSQCSLPRG